MSKVIKEKRELDMSISGEEHPNTAGTAMQKPSLLDRHTVGRDLKSERSPGGYKEGFSDIT